MIKNIVHKIDNKTGLVSTFLNPYSYLMLRKKPELLEPFDSIRVDGAALVLLFRVFGIKCIRSSFDSTSLAPQVFETARQRSTSIYCVGSRPSEISLATDRIRAAFPGLKIVGLRDGYFKSQTDISDTIDHIIQTKTELVIIGMGAGAQEIFIKKLIESGWSGQAYTCGGFFHQVAKRDIKYYPKIVNSLHLRWIYRIIDEPKLFKRYALLYPIAALLIVKDLLAWKFIHAEIGKV